MFPILLFSVSVGVCGIVFRSMKKRRKKNIHKSQRTIRNEEITRKEKKCCDWCKAINSVKSNRSTIHIYITCAVLRWMRHFLRGEVKIEFNCDCHYCCLLDLLQRSRSNLYKECAGLFHFSIEINCIFRLRVVCERVWVCEWKHLRS